MTQDVISDVVAHGEGSTVEFKRSMTKDIGRALCAFANADGGTILNGRCRYGPKSDLERNRRQCGGPGTVGGRVKARVKARVRARVRARVAGIARPGAAGRETALEVRDGRWFGTLVRVRRSQESHPRSAERRAHRLHDSRQAEQPTSETPNHASRAIGTRRAAQVSPFRCAENGRVHQSTAYLAHPAGLSSRAAAGSLHDCS